MTKDDILRMGREAGLPDPMVFYASYERFANLVASAARNMTFTQAHWTDYEESIVAAEREACAKVCEAVQQKNEDNGAWMWEAKNCAAAIRARGTHDQD